VLQKVPRPSERLHGAALLIEIRHYLAAVELFRAERREPRWI
jgi:hypothetical protein